MADDDTNLASQNTTEPAGKRVSEAAQKDDLSAASALHDARDELTQQASGLAAEATEAAASKGEEAQRSIGDGLGAIAGALRAAGDHLAEQEQGTASRLIQDTAKGFEQLATSLKEKSLEDVIGEIRSFGRNNAGALFAGSALAGLALARLVRTTSLARPEGGSPLKAGQAPSASRPSDGALGGSESQTAGQGAQMP